MEEQEIKAEPVASRRGGARPGAGRKPKVVSEATARAQADARNAIAGAVSEAIHPLLEETLGEVPLVVAVATARKRIGAKYPDILDALFSLLDSSEQVTQRWEPAGTVLADAYGEPDEKGRQAKVKVPLFPDKEPDELVLMSETVTTYPPDAAAAQYLFNRLAGRPAEEKTNPLDEAGEGAKMPTREELLADLLGMMLARWEGRTQRVPGVPVAGLIGEASERSQEPNAAI